MSKTLVLPSGLDTTKPYSFGNIVTFGTNVIETASTATISASTITFDLSVASVFNVTLNSNITTMNITNPAASTSVSSFAVVLTYTGTSYSVTWNAAIKWPGGTAPTLTNTDTKKDVFVFFTTDGGTSYYGFTSGQNL